MSADVLIAALDGVRKTGKSSWLAKCPAHGDKRASLTITEKDDGRVLMHCFAGCSVHEVCGAANVDLSELFPPRESSNGKPERRPFNAIDILRAVAYEALVVSLIAADMQKGPITEKSRDRLITAASRLQNAERIANGN